MTDDTYSDLDQLNLSLRTYHALRRAGVHTVRDVLSLGRAHFEQPGRRIGPIARMEIARGLEESGFRWTAEGAPPLPELPPAAVQMVEALGLGDSAAIRRGLARVLVTALDLPHGCGVLSTAADLEHGAR
jgi:hypothetical protein